MRSSPAWPKMSMALSTDLDSKMMLIEETAAAAACMYRYDVSTSTLFASQQIIRHCITNKYDERFLTLRFRKGAYHVPLTANVVCLKVCLRSVFTTNAITLVLSLVRT